ncbi:unnamed protein product [Ambrosiozyma monospora]|uniref:Unnamed protein product n=1 Tax=Ambrosiozyma monospora TaxID=43982 RepID=A0ACB5T9Y1_AMBMO|nr:unnamed protein product [Ambrosiozyma monospora]
MTQSSDKTNKSSDPDTESPSDYLADSLAENTYILQDNIRKLPKETLPYTRKQLDAFLGVPVYKRTYHSVGDDIPKLIKASRVADQAIDNLLQAKQKVDKAEKSELKKAAREILIADHSRFSNENYRTNFSGQTLNLEQADKELKSLCGGVANGSVPMSNFEDGLSLLLQDFLDSTPTDEERLEFFKTLFLQLYQLQTLSAGSASKHKFTSLTDKIIDSLICWSNIGKHQLLIDAICTKSRITERFELAKLRQSKKTFDPNSSEHRKHRYNVSPQDHKAVLGCVPYSGWIQFMRQDKNLQEYLKLISFCLNDGDRDRAFGWSLIQPVIRRLVKKPNFHDLLTELFAIVMSSHDKILATRILFGIIQLTPPPSPETSTSELRDQVWMKLNKVEGFDLILSMAENKMQLKLADELEARIWKEINNRVNREVKAKRVIGPVKEFKKKVVEQVFLEVRETGDILN